MQKVYLCRHGETEWSKTGRHTSYTDLELTKNGEKEAELLKKKIAHLSHLKTFISPLKRARQTAAIASFKGVVLDDLSEWNYGEYEGMTTAEIRKIEPRWNIFTHGARGGESIEAIQERTQRVIHLIKQQEEDVILFSSGHFTRALAASWMEESIELGRHLVLSTASLSVLGYEHDYPAILCWNHT
ncbi:MAG: histidine phosphatase family protein [Simkaniaceae bacterium]|nr:histidine phosphatase family protein [Simkaniaceae bacterium]MCF7852972.1 histidine phosphatase family protein [Simkaniaceae bacterium]